MFEPRFLIRLLIYGQPFFWMWLYDTDIDLSPYRDSFYILSGSFCVVTLAASVVDNSAFEYYTKWLLFLYAFMVMFTTFMFDDKFKFTQSLCLAFLLVFMNSYVWEFMLHLTSYMSYGISSNDLLQMWHLIPLPWLLKKFHFIVDKNAFLTTIQRLMFFETLIAIFMIEVIYKYRLPPAILHWGHYIRGALYNFNRIVSLLVITIPVRFMAVEKRYKGTCVTWRWQGVAQPDLEEHLD